MIEPIRLALLTPGGSIGCIPRYIIPGDFGHTTISNPKLKKLDNVQISVCVGGWGGLCVRVVGQLRYSLQLNTY